MAELSKSKGTVRDAFKEVAYWTTAGALITGSLIGSAALMYKALSFNGRVDYVEILVFSAVSGATTGIVSMGTVALRSSLNRLLRKREED